VQNLKPSGRRNSSKFSSLHNFIGWAPQSLLYTSPTRSLTTPILQQAACYFLTNFVLIPEAGAGKSYLNFVVPLLNARDSSASLPSAFSAVALAAFGARPNSRAVEPKSHSYYLKALREIKTTVADPLQATNDSVIASVLLLARFEARPHP
jgi:hypothetical protein